MSNLTNSQINNLRMEINYGDYWDFFINSEFVNDTKSDADGSELYDKCLISFIDTTDASCIDKGDLVGKGAYRWDGAVVVPHILHNVGYTGLDNGLIPFRRDIISNKEFLNIYQHSKYEITSDTKLRLHKVDGGTRIYEYPACIENGLARLNGGFYQGFFKTECDSYQVLPSELNNGDVWNLEFVLNKTEFEKESDKTLNDKHPNNKGIFFYIGTRAENKWDYLYHWDDRNTDTSKMDCLMQDEEEWHDWRETFSDDYLSYNHYDDGLYEQNDSWYEYADQNQDAKLIDEESEHDSIEPCSCYVSVNEIFDLAEGDDLDDPFDYIENDLDISDFEFSTEEGFTIGREKQTFFDTDNKFLLMDRTCNGYTVDNYRDGDKVRYVTVKNDFKGNLFLLMDRTCNGYTVDNIDELRDSFEHEYDYIADITRNALAFRITDEGKIGYRYLIRDCDSSGYKIIEGYSKEGVIIENEWHTVNVRVKAFMDSMKLEFYIDGKLVFLTNEMPKLKLRKLDDIDEKQETVPFNISLGGGTQGLCDTILPNYMLDPYRVYPLEDNFGGSFIGYIKIFRFYNCNMSFLDILNNYRFEIQNN